MNRKEFFKTLCSIPVLSVIPWSIDKNPIPIANDAVTTNITIASNEKYVFTLNPNGNIKLGTAYPNYRLDVKGLTN